MRVINFSEARNNLKKVLDQVVEDADYSIFTRRNAKDAVIMSLENLTATWKPSTSSDHQLTPLIYPHPRY